MLAKRSLVVLVGSVLALSSARAARAQDVPPEDPMVPAPDAAPPTAEPAPAAAAPAEPEAAPSDQSAWMPTPAPAAPPEVAEPQRTALNSVYAELMGPAFWYSLNYERMVLEDLAVRAGFSFLRLSASASSGGSTASASATYVTVPLTVSYTGVRTASGHGLDVGGGPVLGIVAGTATSNDLAASGTGFTVWGNVLVGYRYQPLDGGFHFRVGLDLNLAGFGLIDFGEPGGFGLTPWGHMSFGGTF